MNECLRFEEIITALAEEGHIFDRDVLMNLATSLGKHYMIVFVLTLCFAGLGCSITGQLRAQQIHWVYHKVSSFSFCSAVKPISLLDPFHRVEFGESMH